MTIFSNSSELRRVWGVWLNPAADASILSTKYAGLFCSYFMFFLRKDQTRPLIFKGWPYCEQVFLEKCRVVQKSGGSWELEGKQKCYGEACS